MAEYSFSSDRVKSTAHAHAFGVPPSPAVSERGRWCVGGAGAHARAAAGRNHGPPRRQAAGRAPAPPLVRRTDDERPGIVLASSSPMAMDLDLHDSSPNDSLFRCGAVGVPPYPNDPGQLLERRVNARRGPASRCVSTSGGTASRAAS